MTDEFGMSVDDFHCEPKQIVLPKRWKSEELPITAGYTPSPPKDNKIEPKQTVRVCEFDITNEGSKPIFVTTDEKYYSPIPRANLILVREHLQNAMRAGLNSEALRCVVAAIKEIER